MSETKVRWAKHFRSTVSYDTPESAADAESQGVLDLV
jgi:hypothetical protein